MWSRYSASHVVVVVQPSLVRRRQRRWYIILSMVCISMVVVARLRPWRAVCRGRSAARRPMIASSRCPSDAARRRRHVTASAAPRSSTDTRSRRRSARTSDDESRRPACHGHRERSWTEPAHSDTRSTNCISIVFAGLTMVIDQRPCNIIWFIYGLYFYVIDRQTTLLGRQQKGRIYVRTAMRPTKLY